MIFIENLWRFKKKILNIILNKKISVKDKINFGSKNANNFFKKSKQIKILLRVRIRSIYTLY